MKTFLEYVAEDILSKYGTNLARVAVVFPNKRASLFMNEHLARLAGGPIWSPAYITISDLFRRHSNLSVADPIKLVSDLHKSFTAVTAIDETLDHFYGWGQVLLADFDDIDKNMAEADKVFANLGALHELDDVSYLSDNQREVIRHFFSNFSEEHNSVLKERFLRLWSHMGDIYADFNSRLRTQQLAYEGALYREVVQREEIDFEYDVYLFVGFNLLQRVEQRLFTTLQRQGKAHFYWDFDHYYMKGNEAGHYISQYLADFPNELDTTDEQIYGRFSQPKHLTYIAAPTENIQARYASTWLQEGNRIADGRQTAIVMCNENLLQTLVHCLPDEVSKVNVTTGYPLSQTPVAAFITHLIDLRTNGYDRQRQRFRLHHVNAVLRHSYTTFVSDEASNLTRSLNDQKIYYPTHEQLIVDEGTALLFRPVDDMFFNSELLRWLCDVLQRTARQAVTTDPLFQESVFRAYTLINRLQALIDAGDLNVDVITLQRLIGQLLISTSIPFHGEPAEGLQVMGVLETRNIDFRHVLLLSCNEGNMPRGINDTSFIPYSIRKAHGLTTMDHKVAIYSYYFHRLLQRADDVTITYNNATTDGQRSEMSRFLLQLMVESSHHISFETLQASQTYHPFNPPTIEKTPEVMDTLKKRFDIEANPDSNHPLLTPTAINSYQRCPLRFYYIYVKNLREPDINDEDEIDNRIFGNIFHEAARIIYQKFMKRSGHVLKSDIEELLRTKVDIERAVDQAFRTELFMIRDPKVLFRMELNGLQIINREVIIHYLRQLLQIDSQLAPFAILDLEGEVVTQLTTPHLSTTIGGRIDRLDQVNDASGARIRVIDYKTGGGRITPLADVEAIFSQDSLAKHSDYYLQTFLYASIVRDDHPAMPVSPALLFIQHARGDDYDPTLVLGKDTVVDIATHQDVFNEKLRQTVDLMFDPDVAFAPTDDRSRCQTCPYYNLCN